MNRAGHQCQPETASDRCTLHGRDDRRAGREQPSGLLVERTRAARDRLLAAAQGARQVRTRAEVPARRTKHDRPRVHIGIKTLEGIGQPGDEGSVEMVTCAALELDRGDVVGGDLDADLMSHRWLSGSSRRPGEALHLGYASRQ